MGQSDYLKVVSWYNYQTCFYFKNDLIKKLESLPVIDLGVVTLANTDINNNDSDVDSNIYESKDEETGACLNTNSKMRLTEKIIIIPSWKMRLTNQS